MYWNKLNYQSYHNTYVIDQIIYPIKSHIICFVRGLNEEEWMPARYIFESSWEYGIDRTRGKNPIKVHTHLSIGARGSTFDISLNLNPHFVYASSEGPG